jgi:MFS transporter, SP family, arabinose:H+ symporter
MNVPLLRAISIGALAGLLFGFDTGVIAGVTQRVSETFVLTPAELGFTVSSALWGTVLGAIISGPLGQRFGSKNGLVLLAICYLASAIGCAVSWDWSALLLFRFVGGVGIGCSTVIAPVYLAEVSPTQWRGRAVGMFQINIVIGILAAYLSNYLIARQAFGASQWRWELGVAAIPAALFFLMLLRSTQSARWLITRGRFDEAEIVLRKLGVEDPHAELATIRSSLSGTSNHKSGVLFQRRYLRPIGLAVALASFNQLAGINAVLYYSNFIFSMAGYDAASGDLQAVAIGLSNLVGTLVALAVIDRFGRRFLLMVGSVGTSACLASAAAIFHFERAQNLLILCLVLFVGFFALSQGAVIWVFLSEIFPSEVRAKGQSLGSTTHWVMNALISWTFPLMATQTKALPFAFFAAMMALQFLFSLFILPETRGVGLEEIAERLIVE